MTYRTSAAFGLMFLVSTHAWAAEPVDASTYTVHCTTLIGKISFRPGLKTGGSGTSVAGKVRATLKGCVATPPIGGGPAVTIQSGAVSGTLKGASNDCVTLLSGGPLSGTLKIKWSTTPKLLDSASFLTLPSLSFSEFFPPPPFTGTYGAFTLNVSGVTGPFQGPDGGASSVVQGTTGQDVTALLAACGGNGLKAINFGLADLILQ